MGHSNIRSTMEYIHVAKMELSVENPLDELMKEENEGKVVNDPNNTNSQKLAGMTIKILKGIGIFILIVAILYLPLRLTLKTPHFQIIIFNYLH